MRWEESGRREKEIGSRETMEGEKGDRRRRRERQKKEKSKKGDSRS